MKHLLLLCMLCGSAAADPASERSRLEVAPAGHAFKKLAIDNPLGDVRIEGYDGTSIQIETHKTAPDEDTLDRLRVSLVPDGDGTVRLTTTADPRRESKPAPRGSVRIDLIIHAPRDARIDATVGSGKLELVNMSGGGELDAASGAISAYNVSGELWTHTVSGPTRLEKMFGSIDAATISADMDFDSITGAKLVASAKSGKIAGRRVRSRDVELTTVDGKIQLEAEAALRGHLVVSSLHGDIEVKLHRHGQIVVKARGTKVDLGQPYIIQPDGWAQQTFGQGDEPAFLEMRSQTGIVKLDLFQ